MIRVCEPHGAYNGTICPACLRGAVADPGRVRTCGMVGFTSPTDRAEDGVAAGLQPPAEHADKKLHWILVNDGSAGQIEMWQWHSGLWRNGDGEEFTPEEVGAYQDRYLGPAEWNPEAPELRKRLATLEAEIAALRAALRDKLRRISAIVGEG